MEFKFYKKLVLYIYFYNCFLLSTFRYGFDRSRFTIIEGTNEDDNMLNAGNYVKSDKAYVKT